MQAEAGTSFGADRSPPGALRILARRGDSQILILHGNERAISDDERLAWVEWLGSPAIAAEMSRFCSYRLATGHFPPDVHGWHSFPVEHLPTLIGNARTHLNIGLRQKAEPTPPRKRQPWSREKDAMFCLFVGQGRSAQSIADDPCIQASVDMVYKQAQRLGLSLQNRPRGQVTIRLPTATLAAYEAAAVREGLTRDALIQRRLMKGPSDPDELTRSI